MASKEEIKNFLKEIEVDDLVRNVQIMGDTVIIDMLSHSPALHEKKRMETAMHTAFEQKFGKDVQLKLNISVEVPEKKDSRGNAIPGIKNIIAVASGKGGVGKSTVASNLATALVKMGFKVGLLDADIYGPSVPTMFDVTNEKPLSDNNKIIPVESYGVKLLSLGFFAGANQAVIWRGAMASKAIHQLLHDANWGELDFLLIDLPPGTGDIHLSIVQEVPVTGSVIVSTPQHVALTDVKKGVAMFQMPEINVPVLGLIENMAYFTPKELPNNKYYIFGKKGVKKLAESMDLPFLGEIPIIQSIREASDYGRPAVLQEDEMVSVIYMNLAKNMISSLVKRNEDLPPSEAVRITTMAGCSNN
ncbi:MULTISPECIES: Mrp/NBP35 family ATP-binding protein [unclassified Apibacter]|uniref:Mrp/NBP35 family ATP-binding protein n=1 Tax=unclassified Apibacter TaxID=2630820 RepID=UPI0013276D47|nr:MULTISPECIES: Mrp/NBP35 family ATP-binding protein [unclassified Apibacter]MCX8676439.1 Mrp/NBP35 family ATP-binding protein [Apibacter sp. B3919]MXO23903.1 P-loop NTPase [Apibacter sp. B3924]MXO26420.1 P-loop NTPase [Apibacter sp. B3813]MXO28372.1 P-loop NTPase [Apibacter sp. B3913]MXO30326.1 P-loop NTPase [Apibacter sp. B3912]